MSGGFYSHGGSPPYLDGLQVDDGIIYIYIYSYMVLTSQIMIHHGSVDISHFGDLVHITFQYLLEIISL